jgi:hypothetical protein
MTPPPNPSARAGFDLEGVKSQAGDPPVHTIRLVMLSESDRAVLEFEGSWWQYPGPKDRAIDEYLGMSSTRYYQVLRRLLDDPDADRAAPLTMRRLRKIREHARRRALERRLGEPGG